MAMTDVIYRFTLRRQYFNRKFIFPFLFKRVCCLNPLNIVTHSLWLQLRMWPYKVKFRDAAHYHASCPSEASEISLEGQVHIVMWSCRSAKPLWLWSGPSEAATQQGGKAAEPCLGQADDNVLDIWTHVFTCQTAVRSCALYSIIPAWSRASRSWEHTHCSCPLLVVCFINPFFHISVTLRKSFLKIVTFCIILNEGVLCVCV